MFSITKDDKKTNMNILTLNLIENQTAVVEIVSLFIKCKLSVLVDTFD